MTETNRQSLQLALPNGGAELEFIPLVGGILNRLVLSHKGKRLSVISGLEPDQVLANAGYRGVPLFPFPNRLEDGTYEFAGRSYQFPVNEKSTNTNLHGFMNQLALSAQIHKHQQNGGAIHSRYHYNGELPYYPFPATINIDYILKNPAEFQLEYTVNNVGSATMPLGIGWHPYFRLDDNLSDVEMRLPTVQRVLVNDRMLPTGELVDFDDFAEYARIGATTFDDCFFAQGETEEHTVSLWSEKASCGLEIWQEKALEYIQIYIPPDRKSIAIEPMSCSVNAFRSGDGLIQLAPGASVKRTFGVRLITEK